MHIFIQETYGHNWHIHAQDIVQDQMWKVGKRCMSANAHYNPYQVSLKVSVQDQLFLALERYTQLT